VPLHRLFGSEEMSAQAPAMAGRVEPAALAVHPSAAGALRSGGSAELRFNGSAVTLPVAVDAGVAESCVGVPVGLAGVPVVMPGAPVTLGGKS
jgi:NADH-quinone oxidoreductase subunit G